MRSGRPRPFVVKVFAGANEQMNVTCRKCGAAVPGDHAFCTECGAVMAEPEAPSGAEARAKDEAFISTVTGHPVQRPSEAGAAERPRDESRPPAGASSAGRAMASGAARAGAVTTREKVRGRSNVYVFVGFGVVILLGLLLLYLLSVIFSR